mmetsp:Transcript_10670/g.15228  ORF Transcript_10670/g.15228 Transcript_10670/m.15228 type:complete len:247 (+) Transcript_10670:1164-1904(+)
MRVGVGVGGGDGGGGTSHVPIVGFPPSELIHARLSQQFPSSKKHCAPSSLHGEMTGDDVGGSTGVDVGGSVGDNVGVEVGGCGTSHIPSFGFPPFESTQSRPPQQLLATMEHCMPSSLHGGATGASDGDGDGGDGTSHVPKFWFSSPKLEHCRASQHMSSSGEHWVPCTPQDGRTGANVGGEDGAVGTAQIPEFSSPPSDSKQSRPSQQLLWRKSHWSPSTAHAETIGANEGNEVGGDGTSHVPNV